MSETKKDYSKYDHMSTEVLEEILKKDYEADETESDIDEILYIMEVIDKRRREKLGDDYPNVEEAWKKFNECYRPIPEEITSLYGDDVQETPHIAPVSAKKKRRLHKWMGAAAAVVVIVGTLSVVAPAATGSSLWETIGCWTSNTFMFEDTHPGVEDDTTPAAEGEYMNLQEALDDYGIEEQLVPTWFPEGYQIIEIKVGSLDTTTIFNAYYENGNDYILISIKNDSNLTYNSYEKTAENIEVIAIGDIEYYFMSNSDNETVTWINGDNECSISSTLTQEELKQMVESICEG